MQIMRMRHCGVSLLKGGAFTIYSLFKLLPQQHKVVLISRLQNHASIDFQYIEQTAKRLDPSLKVVVLNHKMTNRFLHVFAILQEMYHLATAKACVVESYVISVSILKHRKSLIIVQIWHALGAVKAFGHMAIGKPEGSSAEIARLMNMHKNYTFVTTGSEASVEIFARAFNVDKHVIKPIGMPRVDYLLNTEIQQRNITRVRKQFSLAEDKKVILYAPTFRKRSPIPYQDLIAAIDPARYTLIIKQHPHDKTTITQHKPGVIINRHFELLELLPVADFVITDYSATVFEAALLKKPLFFWVFDEEKYAKRRGFAIDTIDQLPGFKSKSPQEIMATIDAQQYDNQHIADFSKRYIANQDGKSTLRLMKLLGVAS